MGPTLKICPLPQSAGKNFQISKNIFIRTHLIFIEFKFCFHPKLIFLTALEFYHTLLIEMSQQAVLIQSRFFLPSYRNVATSASPPIEQSQQALPFNRDFSSPLIEMLHSEPSHSIENSPPSYRNVANYLRMSQIINNASRGQSLIKPAVKL